MNSIMIYALCGRVRSGKSTVGKYLVERYEYTRLRFADPLKKMLREGLGIDDEFIDGERKGESCEQLCGKTARHAMITLGTEWGRNMIGKDIWVNALHSTLIEKVKEGKRRFVIDDLRFLSEEKWLNKMRYFPTEWICRFEGIVGLSIEVIRIDRDGTDIIHHQSEQEIMKMKPDWVVCNNNGLDSLYKSVDDIVKRTAIN